MTRSYQMLQVDVFTDRPLTGNPLAVFPDARGLEDAEMQKLAREMNLSETTFVLQAEDANADYRVRIFTPGSELPFAGHPTVGTAHALLDSGALKRDSETFALRQQTLAGIQTIDVRQAQDGREYTMTQPPPTFRAGPPVADLAAALGVAPEDVVAEPLTVAVGVAWHVVPLRDLDVISRLAPDLSAVTRLAEEGGAAGVTVFCIDAEDPSCRVRLRTFAPGQGIPEDPVCGSCNGCVGAFLAKTGLMEEKDSTLEYTAEQGIEIGRPGRVAVRVRPEGDGYLVQVGGRAVTVLRGEVRL